MNRFHPRAVVAGIMIAIAVALGAATAPAQQTPPGIPHQPGVGEPTSTPGAPTPAPIPSLFASASPSPLPGASANPGASSPAAGPTLPVPLGSPQPPNAAATPRAVVEFTGELLDLRNGYVFFTTSDAFKASPAIQIVDFDTGGPTRLEPGPAIYARATLDPASGQIVKLALTARKLEAGAAYQQAYAKAHVYAVKGSGFSNAPELRGVRHTGRPVAVTFVVQVPPTTPLTDSVYITSDASGWVANAMKMDRIDALHYRLTRVYASGTLYAYRYTRGSWTSVEVGEDGLQGDPRIFTVPEVDAKLEKDTVYSWSDQNPSEPNVGPNNIPTPFNPNPFGGFPVNPNAPRQGIPQPSPTPRP